MLLLLVGTDTGWRLILRNRKVAVKLQRRWSLQSTNGMVVFTISRHYDWEA
jgi:hypothetical protein